MSFAISCRSSPSSGPGRGAGDDRRRKQLAVNLVVVAAAAATLNSFGGVPAGDAEDGRSDGEGGREGACKRRLGLRRRRRCIVSPCLS